MSDEFGSDYITIVDEEGTEYELEVLTTLEYKDATYLAVILAGADEGEDADLEISILKSVEEDGEPILCAVEDGDELSEVYERIMEQLYAEDAEEAEED